MQLFWFSLGGSFRKSSPLYIWKPLTNLQEKLELDIWAVKRFGWECERYFQMFAGLEA